MLASNTNKVSVVHSSFQKSSHECDMETFQTGISLRGSIGAGKHQILECARPNFPSLGSCLKSRRVKQVGHSLLPSFVGRTK